MPSAAAPPDRSWLGPALAIVGAVTLARVAVLAVARHDLFVDEAQYWLWGQDFAFGYYSKPPLIAWVIGGTTALAGSDAPFWIRLPAPLFHAATALILGAIAARHISGRAAVWVAAGFVTLPMVALGSLLISTDTIMFPFLALALGGYLGLLLPGGGGRPGRAAGVGVALGLAFLAKYSAAFYLVIVAAAALRPNLRPVPGDAAAILAAFGLTIAPNLLWNAANGFATVSHTVDNSGWREGPALDLASSLEFLASQLLVFGPILFGALMLATAAAFRPGAGRIRHLLAVLALPLVLVFTLQALFSRANANWAAPAYLAGTLLAVPWLLGRARGWLLASFVVNGALCLALPIAAMQADTLRIGGRLVLARYAGLDELSRSILAEAEARGAVAILAEERAVLADLFHTGRDAALPVFAWPRDGSPRNHYEQRHAYAGAAQGPLFAVTRGERAPPCAGAPDGAPDGVIDPGPGAYEGRPFRFWLVPPDCWPAP